MTRVDFSKIDKVASEATKNVQSQARRKGLEVVVNRRKDLAEQKLIEEDRKVVATARVAKSTAHLMSEPATRRQVNDFIRVGSVPPPATTSTLSSTGASSAAEKVDSDFNKANSLAQPIGDLENSYLLNGLGFEPTPTEVTTDIEIAEVPNMPNMPSAAAPSSTSPIKSSGWKAKNPIKANSKKAKRPKFKTGNQTPASNFSRQDTVDFLETPNHKVGDLSLSDEQELDRAIALDLGSSPTKPSADHSAKPQIKSEDQIETDLIDSELDVLAQREDFGGIHRVYGHKFKGEHFAKVANPKVKSASPAQTQTKKSNLGVAELDNNDWSSLAEQEYSGPNEEIGVAESSKQSRLSLILIFTLLIITLLAGLSLVVYELWFKSYN